MQCQMTLIMVIGQNPRLNFLLALRVSPSCPSRAEDVSTLPQDLQPNLHAGFFLTAIHDRNEQRHGVGCAGAGTGHTVSVCLAGGARARHRGLRASPLSHGLTASWHGVSNASAGHVTSVEVGGKGKREKNRARGRWRENIAGIWSFYREK